MHYSKDKKKMDESQEQALWTQRGGKGHRRVVTGLISVENDYVIQATPSTSPSSSAGGVHLVPTVLATLR